MATKSFVDADGNRRWADEHSKAYQDHVASRPAKEPQPVVEPTREPVKRAVVAKKSDSSD